jgi:serine protease inhibitor
MLMRHPKLAVSTRRGIVLAIVAGLAACARPMPTDLQPSAARTNLPRALSPAEASVRDAANDFSFALWNKLIQGSGDSNVFVSPLSASFALGMALGGARGTTADELRSGLQLGTSSLTDIDAGYQSLIDLLTSLDPSVAMSIGNSIWYRDTVPFNQSFLDNASKYFGATVSGLDFNDSPASTAKINGWVKARTNGKITSIVDTVESDDVMFLINAIYFKGQWRRRFDPGITQSGPFHSVRGDQHAHLMHGTDDMAYAESATFQAVDLAYGDSAFTMSILLPKPPATVESVAASLTAAGWASFAGGFAPRYVDLVLPRLTLTWDHDLNDELQALGVHQAFVPQGADFTGMSTLGRKLSLSRVRQKAYVNVDEEGTEAAAVTSGEVVATALRVPTEVRVDRPFVFLIRERLTGTVLFIGKVVALE